jgi:hypothetical protein
MDPALAQTARTLNDPQRATATLAVGRSSATARVRITPAGLLAIGGLVAAVLLSVPPIIRAARAD